MRTIMKYTAAVTLAGALAVASAVPSQARWNGHHHWRNGAAIGAALRRRSARRGSGNGYYGPGYVWLWYRAMPTDRAPYAYEPGPVYGAPRHYYGNWNAHDCTQSPASPNYVPCNK